MAGSRARRALLVTATALGGAVLLGAGGVGGYAVTAEVHAPTSPTPSRSSSATPSAVAGATDAPPAPAQPSGTPATASGVARALAPLVGDSALGDRLTADVRDAATGTTLFSRTPASAVAPASTGKLLTAAAILLVHRPTDRFTTRVVAGPGTAVTIVGGGDPTLTGAAVGRPGFYRGAARVTDLAAAVHRAGLRPSRIYVDDSLFTGPSVSPSWAAEDVPSTYGCPITALMVDGGRAAPTDAVLSSNPDLSAGQALARALGTPSLAVARGRAPAGARTVASVRSAPVASMVTAMLQLSDNIIAEVLGRQVALASSEPASFTGGAGAIRATLTAAGVDPGAGMVDASGLAARDRLSAATLASVLVLATGSAHPALHDLVAGLPVAGWSGTLADRYLSGTARSGAGAVRAKTGTLTGVSTLAGVVRDASGRLLAFALMADRAPSTPLADAALDRLAGRLAACGCT